MCDWLTHGSRDGLLILLKEGPGEGLQTVCKVGFAQYYVKDGVSMIKTLSDIALFSIIESFQIREN